MNIQALLADGWFYVSGFGLMVSAVLFVYLNNQRRAAAAAADHHDGMEAEAPVAVRPVFVPVEPVAMPKPVPSVAPVMEEKPKAVEPVAAAPAPAPAPAPKK